MDTSHLKGAGRLFSVFIFDNIITTFMIITLIMSLVSNVICEIMYT